MDPFITGSIVSGSSNLLGSIINGIFGVNEAQKDRDFNAAEAQKNRYFQTAEREAAQEWDLNMWNMTNEYNSIGSQIDRARAAGVNPAALLGGQYKSAQANAPTTTPQQGSAASSSSGGAVGSALINSSSQLASSFTNGIKSFVDGYVQSDMLALNKEVLSSQITSNFAIISKTLKECGLIDANEEQVRKATSWMDGLNQSVILERGAHATLMYNQSREVLQQILESQSRIAVNESTIKLNEKQGDYIDAQTALTHLQSEYQSTLNQYSGEIQQALLTQEQVKAAEANLRRDFANHFGIPLGSSEFEFMWQLHLNGRVEEFIKGVVVPKEQSKWTPRDVIVPYTKGGQGGAEVKLFGIPFGASGDGSYNGVYDGRYMIMNPQYSGPPPLTPTK